MGKLLVYINMFLKIMLPDYIYQIIATKYIALTNQGKEEEYRLPYLIKSNIFSKRKYCIFRFETPIMGMAATIFNCLFFIEWAESKGYIPIIDVEFIDDIKDGKLGRRNAWDDIFENNRNVKSVLNEGYVLVAGLGAWGCHNKSMCQKINGVDYDIRIHYKKENWREYYSKVNRLLLNKLVIRKEIDDFCQKFAEQNFGKDRVLGIALREEFSREGKKLARGDRKELLEKHPTCIEIEDIIKLTKVLIGKWGIDKVFLSTMHESSIERFREYFGEKVICLKRERVELVDYFSMDNMYDANETMYQGTIFANPGENWRNYMNELLILSKCNYFIASPSGGAILSLALNAGKYEDVFFLEDLNEKSRY